MAELKKKQVAMFGGYFDESGIGDASSMTVIAGFLGGCPALHNMSREWKVTLRSHGVFVPFHAKQFYAHVPAKGLKDSTNNPYKGWSKTKRKKYISQLIGILEKYNLSLNAIMVDAAAFRSRTLDERRWMTGGLPYVTKPNKWKSSGKPNTPYHYALRSVIEGRAERIPAGKTVHIFMSEQNEYEGFSLQLYRLILDREPPFDFRPGLDDSITFASHAKYPPLQAADLAAYHFYQYGIEGLTSPGAIGSNTFRRIVRLMTNNKDLRFGNRASIERECARFAQLKLEAKAKHETLKRVSKL